MLYIVRQKIEIKSFKNFYFFIKLFLCKKIKLIIIIYTCEKLNKYFSLYPFELSKQVPI